MTINNYDDNDLALVQNGYPDFMREMVHQLEVGEEGTPHIQAWIKLQRQQRLSFVRKLFPRGHFKPITSDEYNQHTKRYAQKNDETKASPAVHTFNDPMNTIESVMKKVIRRVYENYQEVEDLDVAVKYAQREMVKEDYKYAKIFVSSTYKQMWKQFGSEMYECLVSVFEKEHTHTHTHSEEIISQEVHIPTENAEDIEDEDGDSREDDASDNESASEADEAYSESDCDDFSEESD